MDIMSETLAVLGIPFEVLTRPLGTSASGESIAMGVEDILSTRTCFFLKDFGRIKTPLPPGPVNSWKASHAP